jgi:hypothetical protein
MVDSTSAVDVMDIGTIGMAANANAGVEVEIFHPGTTKNLGIFITVLGKDSAEFLKLQRAQQKRRMDKMAKFGAFKVNAISPEEIEEDAVELLAACTKKWRQVGVKDGCIKWKGQELACTMGNAEMVYAEAAWLKEQIDAAIGDRSLFTKAS